MAKKYTQEEFVKMTKAANPNIEILGKYINMNTKIRCHCKIHSYEWDGYPMSILKGCGCKYCKSEKIRNALSLPYNEFISRIKPSIEIIGEYINTMTPILVRCKICGHEWMAYPNNLLKGYGCPLCSGRYKDNDIFLKELSEITNTILPLEEYKGAATKILCKCLICNRQFRITPQKLLQHRGCPFCRMSKGEEIIKKYLDENSIKNVPQMKFKNLVGVKGGQLSYDFYLLDYNLLIEYQGEYHDGTARLQTHDGFLIQQEHDKRKREYAESHNIELLEIWYWDKDNIEEILNQKLNINDIKKSA